MGLEEKRSIAPTTTKSSQDGPFEVSLDNLGGGAGECPTGEGGIITHYVEGETERAMEVLHRETSGEGGRTSF